MFGNGKSNEERQKEKERKKRGTRKYGQGRMKHSRMGVVSCWMAVLSMLILAGCILYAYLTGGNAAGIVGGLAVISPVFSACGLRFAVKGFRERDRRYIFCKIGLPSNALMLLIFCVIFIGGLG